MPPSCPPPPGGLGYRSLQKHPLSGLVDAAIAAVDARHADDVKMLVVSKIRILDGVRLYLAGHAVGSEVILQVLTGEWKP